MEFFFIFVKNTKYKRNFNIQSLSDVFDCDFENECLYNEPIINHLQEKIKVVILRYYKWIKQFKYNK